MIQLNNVSKKYRIGKADFYALKDVDLHINAGEFLAICGASGSGKSTLLNIIGCMDRCSSGTYALNGTDVTSLSDERISAIRNTKIGFVLQDFALVNDQSALFNVMLPLLLGNTPYHKIQRKAKTALKRVGLSNHITKKVSLLSGGERQRVAIARAIVIEPAILLADEPTGQLDSKTGKQIMELLCDLHQKGITILTVTHDADVAAYADRTLTVKDGELLDSSENFV